MLKNYLQLLTEDQRVKLIKNYTDGILNDVHLLNYFGNERKSERCIIHQHQLDNYF